MPKDAPLLLQNIVDKEPTDLVIRFAEWLEDNSGYKVDMKSVHLATAARMMFQKSDENQKVLEERREARLQSIDEKNDRIAAREAASAAKKAAVQEGKVAPKTREKVKPLRAKKAAAPEKEAPARPARGAAKKAATKKAAPPNKKAKVEADF